MGDHQGRPVFFLPMLMLEEPEIFGVRLGYVVEGIW
jgi:hypothetical protein